MRTIALALALTMSLSGCEAFLGASAEKKFPAPGLLVEVGGRMLQLDCRGHGSPTVVLESGADIYGSLGWANIHDELATTTRACAWSHAGMMWSDSRESTLNAEDTANDLHALLAAANEAPPFVLVAHSRGALYNLIFNDLYGVDVVGLVFLDPSHPEQSQRRAQQGISDSEQPLTLAKWGRWLRPTGLTRLFPRCTAGVTPEVNAVCEAYFPHSLDGFVSETSILTEVKARSGKAKRLGEKPVIVLTRQLKDEWLGTDPVVRARIEKSEVLWRELTGEYASWTTRGERRMVPDSSHQMLISHPASVTAIKDVVQMVRSQ